MPIFYAIDPRDPERDTVLEVEFTIDHHGSAPQTYGPPENCDPGKAPEITLVSARGTTDANILGLLTTDQYEAIENEIIENYDCNSDDDCFDGDWE